MVDVSMMVEVGKMVREIQSDMRCAKKYEKDAYAELAKLNGILSDFDGKTLQMDEVLNIGKTNE